MVGSSPRYLRVEFNEKAAFSPAVDDAEFYFTPGDEIVQFRSARRNAPTDFGANRKRMDSIRIALNFEAVNTGIVVRPYFQPLPFAANADKAVGGGAAGTRRYKRIYPIRRALYCGQQRTITSVNVSFWCIRSHQVRFCINTSKSSVWGHPMLARTPIDATHHTWPLLRTLTRQVPVLRNRRRIFFFGESPFDGFGPPLGNVSVSAVISRMCEHP